MMKHLGALCIVLLSTTQMCCQVLDMNMMPDAFDDQYIGCEKKMENEVKNKILAEERKYPQFNAMWEAATKSWNRKNKNLPSSFKDEYGVAVVLYTMEVPYPIYKQLNNNISIAGKSRDSYMTNFHFKALHFYLTRALQELRKGCAKNFTTYRGSRLSYKVSPEFRFGQFASSSLSRKTAEKFGTTTFYTISTCFGVDIADLSDFEEQEVLIPISEEFRVLDETRNHYTVQSTGRLCSYFNCAYFGGECDVIFMRLQVDLNFYDLILRRNSVKRFFRCVIG
ncbi:ecto-ADP-ribosyltransferase 5-like [Leptodactylus fuscus]|uniref:ecto-ADP-ribosyltransferase 5-like n=1 Tax=Leptodactylus fuscus TaxID=238119 RepID=UPI003F4EB915